MLGGALSIGDPITATRVGIKYKMSFLELKAFRN